MRRIHPRPHTGVLVPRDQHVGPVVRRRPVRQAVHLDAAHLILDDHDPGVLENEQKIGNRSGAQFPRRPATVRHGLDIRVADVPVVGHGIHHRHVDLGKVHPLLETQP